MTTAPLCALPLAGLLAVVLTTAGPVAAGRDKEPDRGEPVKPKVSLRADPGVGFTPVTAVLTGELTGVDPSDPNFCHAAMIWIRLDPGDSEETASTLRQDPVCRHGKEETAVKTYFTRRFTLTRPGSYLFKLVLEAKDGTTVHSDYARVRVMRVQ